jgi:hypothetical protein
MSTDRPVWLKREDETDAAYAAFSAFRDMGPGRAVDPAYLKLRESCGRRAGEKAPNSWWKWAVDFDWKVRVRAYDEAIEAERLEIEARRRRERVEKTHDLIDSIAQKAAKLAGKTLDSALQGLRTDDLEEDSARNVTARIRAAFAGVPVATAALAEATGISELLDGREALDREEAEEDGE